MENLTAASILALFDTTPSERRSFVKQVADGMEDDTIPIDGVYRQLKGMRSMLIDLQSALIDHEYKHQLQIVK